MANDADGRSNLDRRVVPRSIVRLLIVAVGLGLWFFTQSLLGSRPLSPGDDIGGAILSRGDGLFQITRPVNEYLHEHPDWANGLLIFSSAIIDVLGISMILYSVFGSSMRPFIGLLFLFALRQLMQVLCALPAPEGMIWHYPGVPSLLVTYSVANDFFFSGHTAIAVFGATQIARIPRRGMLPLAIAIVALEASTVIVLRAHYTMDVYAGAITAILAAILADRIAPYVDRAIA